MIRIVLDELDREQEKEVRQFRETYDTMGFQHHDISMIKEFKKYVEDSRKQQLDDVAVQAIKELRKKVSNNKKARVPRRSGLLARIGSSFSLNKSFRDTDSVSTSQFSQGNDVNESIIIRESIEARRKSLDSSGKGKDNWFKIQRTLIEDHFGKLNLTQTDIFPAENQTAAAKKSRRLPTEHLSQAMIDDVLESSLTSYFEEGSVVAQMLRGGIEVAWFGDRHPKEAIYCLCVNRKTKTVTVVFRGSVTAHNWVRNLQIVMTDHRNPIWEENYDGWDNVISLHTGFSLYLLRKRKVDGNRKIDEIFTRLDHIGRELDSEGRYHVCVTGHSLGGALATIFSFYAAADPRFNKIGPVRAFTYAAPRVGDLKFMRAYQQLERTNRLLHARFVNACDFVPLVPTFSLEGLFIGQWYKHVGLQVRLHKPGWKGRLITQKAKMVSYTSDDSWWSFLKAAYRNNFIINLTTLSNFAQNHKPPEHQRRLNFARQIRVGLAEKGIGPKKKMYTLEGYYQLKARFDSDKHADGSSESHFMFAQNVILISSYSIILLVLIFCVFSFLVMAPDTVKEDNVKMSSDLLVVQKNHPPVEIIGLSQVKSEVELPEINHIDIDTNDIFFNKETGDSQCPEEDNDNDHDSANTKTKEISDVDGMVPRTAFTSIGSRALDKDAQWNASGDSNSAFMAFVKARSSEMKTIYGSGDAAQVSIEKSSISKDAHAKALKTIMDARTAVKGMTNNK
uniref:Fungal lipase-type domain-containing protein n=1 Tax=Ditylum brightwellii TaxID=49249 RepID=A0A7S4QJ03_9STRA|mmetsp:Transcript_7356/g.10060  ORF Transcript_7356/g.10060 Transcript_7356/m.10060 type:complete len:733 (+) Transcript_7356:436-2634(+)